VIRQQHERTTILSLGTKPTSPHKPVRSGNEGLAPIPADARPLKGHIDVTAALTSEPNSVPASQPEAKGGVADNG
jgi:hypothetical protein